MKQRYQFALSGVASSVLTALSMSAFLQSPTVSVRAKLPTLTTEQQEILSHFSIVYRPDGQGGTNKTLRVSGLNLQLVNGLGATNGYPPDPIRTDPTMTAVNGLGNLILGYDEAGGTAVDRRGSHNLVTGVYQSYASFGGVAFGAENALVGPFASVTGGQGNEAATFCSVGGGEANDAHGAHTTVCGGVGNVADGTYSAVAGGESNTADGVAAAVSGGKLNAAVGFGPWVGGGEQHSATGDRASISGGRQGAASGRWSSIGGGSSPIVTGDYNWRAGGLFQSK